MKGGLFRAIVKTSPLSITRTMAASAAHEGNHQYTAKMMEGIDVGHLLMAACNNVEAFLATNIVWGDKIPDEN